MMISYPIFGIIGMPFSSNFKPGAKSLIISAGGWPYCCISYINSINLNITIKYQMHVHAKLNINKLLMTNLGKLSGSVSYTANIF